jgi:hypothetical protein
MVFRQKDTYGRLGGPKLLTIVNLFIYERGYFSKSLIS